MAAVSPEEVAFAGAARQAELVRSGELTPSELVELYLERIQRIDPKLNSYRTVFGERALGEAREAEARLAKGEHGALLGVPVALKDNVAVAGEVATMGTDAYGGPAQADSELVRRVRAAGGVPIGLTNLPELAIFGFTESEAWGVTRNPWDLERTPGGSSGGSAVAMAAGLCGIAEASDGAGSIRIPSANCGLFGLKTQRGRVSLAPDAEHWHGLSVYGCVSRGVLDSAIFYDAVAGPAPGDANSPPPWERPLAEAARTPPGKLRIAVSTKTILPNPLADEVRAGIDETAELLRSLGHDVVLEDPGYGLIARHFYVLYFRGIRDEARAMSRYERLEPRTRGFSRLGAVYSDRAVRRARRAGQKFADSIARFMEGFDLLITPTTARLPVEVRRWEGQGALRTINGMSRVYPYCAVWNFTGQPAAAVPAGFTEAGLPRSVQLIARQNDEATLVSLAAQIEAERPWADRRPPLG
jgi:amidase